MKLSVIIPNRNDTVMLAITVRSALEALKSIKNGGEVVVVDNSDEDIWRLLITPNKSPLDLVSVKLGRIKLIRQQKPSLYAARQKCYEYASGEYCYNLDSHVLLGRNTLKDAVDFFDNADEKIGYGYVPISWISHHESWGRHDIRTDQESIFGNWGRQYNEPTRVCWNFGFHICKRDWFLNQSGGYRCFAKDYISWGGGEFYSGIKSWLLGYQNWAIPTDAQYHIGPFCDEIQRIGYPYRMYDKSGNGNNGLGVLVAFYALAGEDGLSEAKKAQKALSQYEISVEKDWPTARKIARNDWLWLKERQVMSLNEFIEKHPWEGGGWDKWSPMGGVELGDLKNHIQIAND